MIFGVHIARRCREIVGFFYAVHDQPAAGKFGIEARNGDSAVFQHEVFVRIGIDAVRQRAVYMFGSGHGRQRICAVGGNILYLTVFDPAEIFVADIRQHILRSIQIAPHQIPFAYSRIVVVVVIQIGRAENVSHLVRKHPYVQRRIEIEGIIPHFHAAYRGISGAVDVVKIPAVRPEQAAPAAGRGSAHYKGNGIGVSVAVGVRVYSYRSEIFGSGHDGVGQ